ncbi:MFS transporter [Streptomyces sp. NPDC059009]|uniref:MFS transporter n=1 Tax=Streptomyces sp. NPDC059009 TaxID=3346694 RepID=UPI0036B922EC
MVGTSIQYFDFFSYGLAAVLIFPDVFFPHLKGSDALLVSFSTIGAAFVARPLGALIFGHFADRTGRKRALILSLVLMGLSTTLMGALPSYAVAGPSAPVLLVILRIAQGIALGAEGMGATVLAIEHAPPAQRGLHSAFPGAGASLGSLAANAVFLGLARALSPAQFETWGWRIPFLAGAALVALSLYARLSVTESPVFVADRAAAGLAATGQAVTDLAVTGQAAPERPSPVPLLAVVRAQPAALLLGVAALVVGNVLYFVTHTFALAYGTNTLGVPKAAMLRATLVALAVQTVAGFASAVLSDRLGRRRTALVGAVLCGAWAFPLVALVRTGQPAAITWAFALAMLVYGIYSGPLGALLAGVFPTRYRFTAVALVFNSGVLVGGALAPAAADRLLAATGSLWAVSGMVLLSAALSGGALLKLTERHPGELHEELEEVGGERGGEARGGDERGGGEVAPRHVAGPSP